MSVFQRLGAVSKERSSGIGHFLSSHTIYLSTMLPFSCFLITVILGIMVWFSSVAGNELKKSVYDSAAHETEVSSESLRIAFQDYIDLSAKLSLLNPLSPRFYQGPHEAYQALKNYNLSSFKFSDLAVFYPHEPKVITIQGSCDFPVLFPEVSQPNALENLLCDQPGTYVTSTLLFGASGKDARLLFVQPLSLRHKAVYILDSLMLNRLLFSNGKAEAGSLFLYNGAGEVLWTNADMTPEVSDSLARFLQSGENSMQIKGKSGSFLWSRSDVSHQVGLARMSPVRNQFRQVQSVTKALAVLCVLLLLLGVAVMVFSHRHSLAPVQNMLHSLQETGHFSAQSGGDIGLLQEIHGEFSRLLNENRQQVALLSSDQLRNLLVLRILCGRYSDMSELKNICRWLSITFPYPAFFACIFLFDHEIGEQEYADVQGRIQAAGSGSVCYHCLSPDEKSIVSIVNIDRNGFAREEWGRRVFARCASDRSLTLGIGQICDDVTALGKSYIEARTAIDYRLIKGENTCICYDAALETAGAAAYPQPLLQKYLEALQSWDVDQIDASLTDVIDYVSGHTLSLQQVKCICFELTSAFLRQAHALGALTDQITSMLDVFSIAEYNSIGELVDKIQKYSVDIRRHITASVQTTDEKLMQRITDYLNQNMANSQFSLNELSDYTGLAIQTIRRKVKEKTGLTLNGYFTRLRIGRAKELLRNTDLSLQTICEQCGYLDVSSFIRLFKAETGVSPGKYREEAHHIQSLSENKADERNERNARNV